MKTIEEVKYYVAIKSQFRDWGHLLSEIKGDVDLIDFYVDCVLIVQGDQYSQCNDEIEELKTALEKEKEISEYRRRALEP